MRLDRRSFVLTGTLGLGAFAVPGFAQTGNAGALRGFTHAVASGEPAADSMLLWTRYVPASGDAATIRVELSETPDFARIAGGEAQTTGPWRDWTVKITVDGLKPATRYHYRFIAPDGSLSPVGQTRTLPQGPAKRFRAAVFSCSNIAFGYFNAYAHAAARGDFDLAIHLGDYFYEYDAGHYPEPKDAIAARVPEPAGELLALADYRLRYASYRADPDLQRLHQLMPMIVQWDDHESANDSWEGGAENHQPAKGDWNARRAAAIQAYREWMPVSDEPWKAYDIGTLATLFRTESRLLARTKQPDIRGLILSADPKAALAKFRDGAWRDPAATMLGTTQESWLAHAMARSVKDGARWQVACFGTIMGETRLPAEAASWLNANAPARSKLYLTAGIMAGAAGLPFNVDNWGGYPLARARFLSAAQRAGANLVVLSGDSHNGWAYDLAQDGRPAGVEFAGPGVTSPGIESGVSADPALVAATLVRGNPELKWCDTARRGYMALTITPASVSNDWVMVDTIKTASTAASTVHSASVAHGRGVMV
ncbi:alkaline phosphatase D family protein [Sphingomonas sp.]|uniref:alkaline phosphatase D family protein n=1 Tax=Sphingomonas sp. TaxID=28214 RepID=UPI001D775E42|nr:alkaline phosphatase D family protein [Sphingomonas sp.]MBX9797761.1 alkaline phosphatase D family protein [Sphingomonas sp.]